MKQFKTSGMTAAAVLIVAVVGGAAGGAMVLGGGSGSDPGPTQIGLKVADDSGPDAAPAATMDPAPGPASVVVPAAPNQEAPVTDPQTETATQAADRSTAAADQSESSAKRSESAAKRAEDAADRTGMQDSAPAGSAPVVEATPTPEPTPEPTPALPGFDTKAGDSCAGHEGQTMKAGNNPKLTCEGGVWRTVPEPTPTPLAP